MSRAAATELLDSLDPLDHPRRMRRLADRAREAAVRGELAGLLEGLEQHGTYGQRLAVVAACAAQDHRHVADRLAHPDSFVRGHAQRAAAAPSSAIPDDALLQALHAAPAAVRAELLDTAVAGGRRVLADGLIDVLRTRWGDAEAARLLPGCTAETVERLLPDLFHAVTGWGVLAARHPAAVLAEAAQQLDQLPPALRPQWWARYGAGVARVAELQPAAVLDLLERHQHAPLPEQLWPHVSRLAAADPGRALRLLLSGDRDRLRRHGLTPSLLRRLVRADPPELAELGRAFGRCPQRLAELLRALPPSRRAAFYDSATDDGDASGGPPHEDVLARLPHERREKEARQASLSARERDEPLTAVLAPLAHVPGEEARAELAEATRGPEPEARARAWTLLVRQAAGTARCTGGAEPLDALLADLQRLRNERDHVRWAALNALAELPLPMLDDDAAGHLDRVAGDALRASDSSHETREALARLARAVLRAHVAGGRQALVGWALRTLVRLSGDTGATDLGRLDRALRRGEEHAVHETLRYWLEAGAEKDDHGLTFALAAAVGRRAAGMPELQETLWQAVQFGSEANARTAVELWLRDPRTRDGRAADVAALDDSALLLPAVSRTVCRRRTDLLGPVLADAPPHGRFLPVDGGRPAPPVGRWTDRWLPRQQRAAAQLLAHEADDDSAAAPKRRAALTRLAHVPYEGARELRLWAGDWTEDEADLAEAALSALVRTERPDQALPLVLRHIDEGRAHAAARALPRASRHVAPSRLAEVLRALLLPASERDGTAPGEPPAETDADGVRAAAEPDDRPPHGVTGVPPTGGPGTRVPGAGRVPVSLRRQAVRLAAALLPVAEAAELLHAAGGRPGQHDDVRAACVDAAGGLLDDPRAWELLESAAQGPPVLCAAVLRAQPLRLPARHRERYARLVTGLGEAADPRLAEAAHACLARWAPWHAEAASVLAAAVTDLAVRRWQKAADGLVELAVAVPGHDAALTGVVAGLVDSEADPDLPDADPGRDRPARRRVEHLVHALGQRARGGRDREAARQTAGRTGVLLARHEEFVPLAARLLCAAVDLEADEETLGRQLHGIAGLHERLPGQAWRTAGELRRSLESLHHPADLRQRLLPVARSLAAEGGHAAGLLAVALAAAVAPGSGWSEPWREFLREVRRHEVPDVRVAALEVATHTGE